MRGETGLLWKWEASTSSRVSSCLGSDTLNLVRSAHQPPKHCHLFLWKMFGSPRTPVPGRAGKNVVINGEKSLTMWAGTVKRELCGYKKERNPKAMYSERWGRICGKGPWKRESEAGENGDQKTNRNTKESGSREGRKTGVYHMCDTPTGKIRNQGFRSCWKKTSEQFCLSFGWGETSSSVSFEYGRARTLFEYLPWVTFFSSLWTGSYGDSFQNRSKL